MAAVKIAAHHTQRAGDASHSPDDPHAPSAQPPAARSVLETLENRQHLSVSMNNGWTDVSPGPGAKVVYVSSSSGNDGNSGLSSSSPLRSIARAEKLLRSGAGDQLLLKRGDTFREGIGFWSISGRSASEPAVLGAYGSGARPVVSSGTQHGLKTSYSGVHDVAVIGIHFDGSGRGGSMPDGIVSSGKTSNFLIEDCEIEGYRNNLAFQSFLGPINNLKVRRSAILDAWSKGSHSSGIYADGVNGILLEENTFDHNGWGHGAGATMFNHGAYITAKSSGLVARGNIFSNSSSHGLQARPGGVITDNAFISNSVGMTYGLVNGGGVVTPGGVTGTVSNNIFTGGHSIGNLANGVGIEISNVKAANVSDNLFFNGDPNARNAAITLSPISGTTNAGQAVGVNNLTVSNNVVYKWSTGIRINKGMSIRNLVVKNNDFQNILYFQAVQNPAGSGGQTWSSNNYDVPTNSRTPIIVGTRALSVSGWSATESGARDVRVSYPDPTRTVGKYASDFLSRARNVSRQTFDPRYTAKAVVSYLKGGFRGGSSSSVPVITPPPANITASPAPTPSTPAWTSPTATPSKTTSGSTSSRVSISVPDASLTEGNSGTRTMTFNVKLSAPSSQKVYVNWKTIGQTAQQGRDYIGRVGTFAFQPGQTSQNLTVKLIGDRTRESSEKFLLQLTSVRNAAIGDGVGVGTILNDD